MLTWSRSAPSEDAGLCRPPCPTPPGSQLWPRRSCDPGSGGCPVGPAGVTHLYRRARLRYRLLLPSTQQDFEIHWLLRLLTSPRQSFTDPSGCISRLTSLELHEQLTSATPAAGRTKLCRDYVFLCFKPAQPSFGLILHQGSRQSHQQQKAPGITCLQSYLKKIDSSTCKTEA